MNAIEAIRLSEIPTIWIYEKNSLYYVATGVGKRMEFDNFRDAKLNALKRCKVLLRNREKYLLRSIISIKDNFKEVDDLIKNTQLWILSDWSMEG